MTPRELVPRESEIAVIGLAKSGRAVAMLLRKHGYNVYASDVACSPDTGRCAEELRAQGVVVDVGRHDLERIARAGLVVTSPGVPPSARPLAFAREKGIAIASEVEVALNFLDGPRIIAITGTNGKTTTTALIAHLLRGLDLEAVEAGNIGPPLLPRRDLPLLGQHNVGNALAASLAVMAADRSHHTQKARKGIAAALRTFRSLPHRLELVGEFGGVQWINDSKATNVSSAAVAIDGMERPTVLLLGGRHKGEAYTALGDVVRRKVKRVIAYGEAAPIIATDLRPVVDVVRLGSDFDEVVQAACAAARSAEAVLLSPACCSYDMLYND